MSISIVVSVPCVYFCPCLPTGAGYRKFLLADATNNSGSARAHDDFLKSLADESEFNWALQCVLSRAFQLPPENAKSLLSGDGKDFPEQAPETEPPTVEEARMGLLPWIDSINHYSRIPTHMYWEGNEVIGVSGEPGVILSCPPNSTAFIDKYYMPPSVPREGNIKQSDG